MITLCSTAMNAMFAPVTDGGEEKLAPVAEVVLIGTRPQYRVGAKDELTRGLAVEEYRFVASIPDLRALAASLTGYADSLEGLVAGKMAVGPAPASGPPETPAPAV